MRSEQHIVRCSVCTLTVKNDGIYLYKVKKFGVSDSFENMRAKEFYGLIICMVHQLKDNEPTVYNDLILNINDVIHNKTII